jgi:pSer/pThr/pTyr-binding forkhead associated (FHA) protein
MYTDLGSTNGSLLNGKDITGQSAGVHLRTGDVLKVGATAMKVTVDTVPY